MTLVKALMNGLEQKGLMDGSDIQGVLDQTLTALEHRPQDKAIDLARRIVEATAMTRAARPQKDRDGSAGAGSA